METNSDLKPAILKPNILKSYDRGGGARTIPLVGPVVGARSFINGITEFAPGTAIPFHIHNCEESVMLLSGNAYLDFGDEVQELKPLDTTWIPPNVSHRFRNRSDTEPMKIFWTYATVNATRTITSTGETRLVSAEHQK